MENDDDIVFVTMNTIGVVEVTFETLESTFGNLELKVSIDKNQNTW